MRRVPARGLVLFAVGLVLVGVVAFYVATIQRNNVRFNEWAAQLRDHPLPADAVLVNQGTRFGVLFANGDHCDGEAWVEFESDLTLDQVEGHFWRFTGAPGVKGWLSVEQSVPEGAERSFGTE